MLNRRAHRTRTGGKAKRGVLSVTTHKKLTSHASAPSQQSSQRRPNPYDQRDDGPTNQYGGGYGGGGGGYGGGGGGEGGFGGYGQNTYNQPSQYGQQSQYGTSNQYNEPSGYNQPSQYQQQGAYGGGGDYNNSYSVSGAVPFAVGLN